MNADAFLVAPGLKTEANVPRLAAKHVAFARSGSQLQRVSAAQMCRGLGGKDNFIDHEIVRA